MLFTALLASLVFVNPIDTIRAHGLDTPEGRTEFLTESLSPYVARADELNREIMALSQEVTQKMDLLNEMLPTLDLALDIDSDLLEIDDILLNSDRLSEGQERIAERIAQICKSIDASLN